MKTPKLLIALAMVMSSLAIAQPNLPNPGDPSQPVPMPPPPPPPPPQTDVYLAAALEVSVCTPGGTCSVAFSQQEPPVVHLLPDFSMPSHLTGHYITIDTTTGVRYIGIITIDNWNGISNGPIPSPIPTPNPGGGGPAPAPVPTPTQGNFTIAVEILDDSGTVAKMMTTVPTPDQIPNAVLFAPSRSVLGNTITAQFNIGPVSSSSTQPPVPIPVPNPHGLNHWTVESGSLR